MTIEKHLVPKNLCLAVFAALSLLLTAGANAAEDTTTAPSEPVSGQQPVDDLEVLDEVWVRGKSLSRVIEVAENDFFKLYNKLNEDHKFDVECGHMRLGRDSMIMVRKCVPGFVASYAPVYVRRSHNVTPICQGSSRSDSDGRVDFSQGCYGSERTYDASYSASQGPSAALLYMHYREQYASNALKVITSDSRLLEMVRELDGLYKEMELVQNRYVHVRAEKKAARSPKATRPGSAAY
jgi:hypothetical protein